MEHRKDYPVTWRDREYHLSDLTIGIKRAYCKWLGRRMLDNARDMMNSAEFVEYRDSIISSPPQWVGDPPLAVYTSFQGGIDSPGYRQLTKLLLGPDAKDLTDDDLTAFLTEKEADENSDYRLAIRQITEARDPKAMTGGHGPPESHGMSSTPRSETTPSTVTGSTSNP